MKKYAVHFFLLCFWLLPSRPILAQDNTIRINFQDGETSPPEGYLVDFGEAYALRTGLNQGGDLTYGWVVPYTDSPLDMTMLGRNRNDEGSDEADLRLATLMHMEHAPSGRRGHWQIALPAGTYRVTVAAGDAAFFTSRHWINAEDQVVLADFAPTETNRFLSATAVVRVNDGHLTLHDSGGERTKINYVEIEPVDVVRRPAVIVSTPANAATDVPLATGVALDLYLPNDAVDEASLTADTVRLIRLRDGAPVPATLNTTGGGDAIILQPDAPLLPDTAHLLELGEGVKDLSGAVFVPHRSYFVTTGGEGDGGQSVVRFDRTVVAEGLPFTSLAFGSDGRLYAVTVDGRIARFVLNEDGTLGPAQIINTVVMANGGEPRVILGMAFDPAATVDDPILWVSHGAPIASSGGAADWTSRISRLSGPDLETFQDVVINLPRSFRNHMTNGIAFGPDGALYALQGGNASTGAPDNTWGLRPERLLSAAILRVDTSLIISPPLDAKTEEGGDYDPFAPEAPITIYATGLRNPYDLVWHSNGQLYATNNGSAAGGNTPATPADLPPACLTRPDGAYSGVAVPALNNIQLAQNDHLYRLEAGGYYGHPNPLRCEWVLNGGNPTGNPDVGEVGQYPVGTAPDSNWRGFAYDFGVHFSANGIIEYQGSAFNNYLTGKLLVARYSRGDDIIALTPGQPSLDIVAAETGLPGLTGFQNPLDLAEDVGSGYLYVTEFAPPAIQRISLLRPLATAVVPTTEPTVTSVSTVPPPTEVPVLPTNPPVATATEMVVATAPTSTPLSTPVPPAAPPTNFGLGLFVGLGLGLGIALFFWWWRRGVAS